MICQERNEKILRTEQVRHLNKWSDNNFEVIIFILHKAILYRTYGI